VRLLIYSSGIIFGLDQITKILVVHLMNLRTVGVIEVWPPVLTFRMAWNRGANFGLFSNDAGVVKWILIALALAISAWVIYWLHKEQEGKWAMISGGFLVGGAAGNVLDRLLYGAVADFLNMTCCGIDNPYAFNVADISIFLGAFGLIAFTGRKKAS